MLRPISLVCFAALVGACSSNPVYSGPPLDDGGTDEAAVSVDVVTGADVVTPQDDVVTAADVVAPPADVVTPPADVVTPPADVVTPPADVVASPDVVSLPDVVDVPAPQDVLPTCSGGETLCGGRCANLTSDRANCGACGAACASSEACVSGACALQCPMGQIACGGRCVTTSSDNMNCGACGNACATGRLCQAGTCVLECPAGLSVCGERCYDLQNDPLNCGSCATVCANGQSCGAGACRGMVCPSPLSVCGMSCVDTRYDPDHCGACGTACAPYPNMTRTCGNGACVPGVCEAGYANCNAMTVDGCEVSTRSDPNNCGGCGRACTSLPNATAACTDGACVIGTCGPGYASCDDNPANGCEVDLRTDRNNCGACGNVCPGTCRDGVCAMSLHNSEPFTGTSALSQGCQYASTHLYRYQSLGNMTWRDCAREASRRGAMFAASQYTTPMVGWGGHRLGAQAMTGRWNTLQMASVDSQQACVIGRDHRATTRDATLSSTVSYDGQTWRYQDYGPRYFDECQLLAAQAGASMITPSTLGQTSTGNYWVHSQHTYNTYSWIVPAGNAFGSNDVGCNARSSQQRCMVGYVDN